MELRRTDRFRGNRGRAPRRSARSFTRAGHPQTEGLYGARSADLRSALGRPPRIALYSHDAVGLGHIRRNLLLAETFAEAPHAAPVLVIAGTPEAARLDRPRNVDLLVLPGLCKRGGSDAPRSLQLPLDGVPRVRSAVILAALEAFRPDVFLVDELAVGVGAELLPALRFLRAHTDAQSLLGFRDVLDEPEAVARNGQLRDQLAVTRDLYDAIWIYGDPSVYDAVTEYDLPREVRAKLSYTGYLARRADPEYTDMPELRQLPEAPIALCIVGSGMDGERLATAFARARMPRGWHGVLVTGPDLDCERRRELASLAAGRADLTVFGSLEDPLPLVARAERVISTGGYGVVFEAIALGKLPLIVPRVAPRKDQWIRAERLRARGIADGCHPDQISGAVISAWLEVERKPEIPFSIDLGGIQRVPELLERLISAQRLRRHQRES
jgi:predicted glycosyltransferase